MSKILVNNGNQFAKFANIFSHRKIVLHKNISVFSLIRYDDHYQKCLGRLGLVGYARRLQAFGIYSILIF